MPRDGNPSYENWKQRMTRRRMIQLSAVGGIAGLAGCGGDSGGGDGASGDGESDGSSDGNGDTVDTPGEDFEPADNVMVEGDTINFNNLQFNHLNLTMPFAHPMQNDWFQRYNFETEESYFGSDGGQISPYAVSLDEIDGETAVLSVREGLTWHNGDPVNADDLYTKFVTDDIVSDTLSTLWTEIQRVDDQSIQLTLDGTVNESLLLDGMNYYALETPFRLYQDYVERWEDATTDDEMGEIMSDIRNDSFDEPHGNGPFQFEEREANYLRMSLYEDHPEAENITWDYWEIQRVSTDTASVLLGMEVDAMRNYSAPESVFQQKPEDLVAAFIPAVWGHSLPFNHEDDDFSDVRVRQAIAEFIDREACANNYGDFGQPVQAPAGLVGNIDGENNPTDRWRDRVSEEMAEQLHRYDDPERGRELLRDADYEKDDGQWYRPDGSEFEVPIKVPAGYNDWHPVYQTVVSNLNEEGISSNMVTIESSAYWSDHYLAGDYKAASTGWTLQRDSLYYTTDMYYNIDTEFMNLDPAEDLEAPPVGELDGELQSVDPQSLRRELLVTQDEERAQELRDELAWITNQTLPMLPIQEINDPAWFTTDDWEIPATDDPIYQSKWPLWWLPRLGELQARPA